MHHRCVGDAIAGNASRPSAQLPRCSACDTQRIDTELKTQTENVDLARCARQDVGQYVEPTRSVWTRTF
eukprot:8981842-Pyramimonas_sp.AAC.1